MTRPRTPKPPAASRRVLPPFDKLEGSLDRELALTLGELEGSLDREFAPTLGELAELTGGSPWRTGGSLLREVLDRPVGQGRGAPPPRQIGVPWRELRLAWEEPSQGVGAAIAASIAASGPQGYASRFRLLKEQHVPLGLMAPRRGGVDLCLRTAKELEEHGLHHAEFKVAEMWLHDYGWDKAVPFPVLNAPTPSVLAATATWARRLARAVNPSAALGRQVTAQVTAATVSLVAFGTNVAGGVRKALDAVASVEPAPVSECRPAVGGVPLGEAVARGSGREWVTAARLSLDAWQQDAAEALRDLGAVQEGA